MKIIFSKKDHKYQQGDTIYTSVSKIISNFKNEFDSDHWSTYKAIEQVMGKNDFKEFKKGWDVSKEEFLLHALNHVDGREVAEARLTILEDWDQKNKKSIKRGNVYHDIREKRSYRNGYELNPFDKKKYKIVPEMTVLAGPENSEQKENLIENLYELEDGYYPELLLWNQGAQVAGQADKVYIETIGNDRFVDIDDYKTNKKIKVKSAYNRKDRSYITMKNPLSHLMDCNYTHYNLQISTYAWILEQFGYKVRHLSFHHYNVPYRLDYLKDEVESMLNALQLLWDDSI